MKTWSQALGALGAMGLLAASVAAQADKPRNFGLSGLFMQTGVQTEIKAAPKQIDQAKKLVQEVNTKHKDDFAKLKDLAGAAKYKAESDLNKTCAEEVNKGLAEVLNPVQMKRLKQIQVQQRGVYAFSEAEVVAALKISKEQTQKLRAVEAEYQKALSDASKQTDALEKAKKAGAANKDAMDKSLAVLDDEQKQTWKELTGEPYKGK